MGVLRVKAELNREVFYEPGPQNENKIMEIVPSKYFIFELKAEYIRREEE